MNFLSFLISSCFVFLPLIVGAQDLYNCTANGYCPPLKWENCGNWYTMQYIEYNHIPDPLIIGKNSIMEKYAINTGKELRHYQTHTKWENFFMPPPPPLNVHIAFVCHFCLQQRQIEKKKCGVHQKKNKCKQKTPKNTQKKVLICFCILIFINILCVSLVFAATQYVRLGGMLKKTFPNSNIVSVYIDQYFNICAFFCC